MARKREQQVGIISRFDIHEVRKQDRKHRHNNQGLDHSPQKTESCLHILLFDVS